MPQNNHKITQQGNVFIFILMGVVLFAALGYTFTRSANKGTGNLTKQQAKAGAQEILNYGRLMEGAVDRVRRNGCSETEISFDNAVVNGYSNTSTPIDGSCSVFHDNGGKLSWVEPSENLFDSAEWSAELYYREWFMTSVCAPTAPEAVMGSRCELSELHDLILLLPYVKKEVCEAINNSSTIPWEEHKVGQRGRFIGNFGPEGSGQHNAISYSDDAMVGWKYGCFRSEIFPPAYSFADNKEPYVFFQVLYER